ncbi:TonB-dependent receptor [Kangiella koreensis]|uniref:TonB-dependent receptor n=1 Tax=Kangiella koreensis (strain DSM 16069 / JCM 12317 / KCTC 12182 / SW-125) TaxID=523791 RepID=C7RBD1_KANKD|nr:TonB-dependent receptor [Kangiella koreensis]ACV26573.1 TonB-dependent receptor [Kangiella koreensis DSM 16069]
MKHAIRSFKPLVLTSLLAISLGLLADEQADDDIETLVINAEHLSESPLTLPSSVTVVDSETARKNNAYHLDDIFNLAPNVNFATGAARGRFIQIRGVGERSEFVEPVNYSVGLIVDGIDMTGIAGGALMLDTQQVEILRGPQGTLYGANALAGLVNMVSAAPEADLLKVAASFESYNGRSASLISSDQLSEAWGYRFAVGQYRSDGYTDNIFLGRDDTQNFDESSIKGRLVYQPDDSFSLTSNLIVVDVDNGYDAFSLDNTRQTYSDEPGHDRQETIGASFIAEWAWDSTKLQSTLSFADSELDYAYDEDWSHTGICEGTPCDSDDWGFDWWYSSFDRFLRDNRNLSLDVKLIGGQGSLSESSSETLSNQWVVGAYFRDQSVDLLRQYTFNPVDFTNQYDTRNAALYGQLDIPLNEAWTLASGLRYERQAADYRDNQPFVDDRSENFWGGKVSLEYQANEQTMLYVLLSRGYKAGGFNTAQELPESQREYDSEYMLNHELGVKGMWPDAGLTLQASVFYQDRDDIQSKQSYVTSQADGRTLQEGGECPCNFTDYNINAGGAQSYGAEIEWNWRSLDWIHLYGSLGLLKTEFENLQSFTHVLADLTANPPVPYDLSGRELAHSPELQWVAGADFYLNDYWSLNLQTEFKDEFYLSDRHQVKADDYQLWHLALTYEDANWLLEFYGRNLTDETIVNRGFGSFGNDPRKFYETEPYFQYGTPRIVGVRAAYQF